MAVVALPLIVGEKIVNTVLSFRLADRGLNVHPRKFFKVLFVAYAKPHLC